MEALLEGRGLSHAYLDIPRSACAQIAALSGRHRYVLTPHGAHEVNLFAVRGNATVVEVMPRWTDIPIYNRLVSNTVHMVSERLDRSFACNQGECEALPPHYGACTRVRSALSRCSACLSGSDFLVRAEHAVPQVCAQPALRTSQPRGAVSAAGRRCRIAPTDEYYWCVFINAPRA